MIDDMKFSYLSTRSDVKNLIKTFGATVTLKLADGSVIRTIAVAVNKKQTDAEPSSPNLTVTRSSIYYLPGDLRKSPDAGDIIEVSSTEAYVIASCEPIKPATTVVAYVVTVEG